MARTVCTYGTLNLNDGVTWFLLPGFDPGVELLTYDEYNGFDRTVKQVNVTEAHLIPMKVPLRIEAADTAGLYAARDALNTLIDAGEQVLRHGAVAYNCAHCPRIHIVHDELVDVCHAAFIDWSPLRYPGSS